MSAAAQLLLASLALAMLALLRAIDWPPPDPRVLRQWRLAGRRPPLTSRRWLQQQLLSCGTARFWLHWQAQLRARRIRRELPALVDRLCIALGCGLAWSAALQLAADSPAGADICALLRSRALLTPAPLSMLARELRHHADALDCLLHWSRRQGIAAYDLRHDASGDCYPSFDPGAGGLQQWGASHHTRHARTPPH